MSMVCGLDLHRQQITFDAWRRSRGRCGGAGCGSPTGNGSGAGCVTTSLGAPTGSRWRWRWRAAPAGGTWSRRSTPPGSRRTSPSRPTRRRRGAASITPRPTAPTPGCCASCCSRGELPESWIPPTDVLEWRERVRLYKSLVDQRRVWIQRIHAELFQHGVAVPGGGDPLGRRRGTGWPSDDVELTPAARQRVRVGYSMLEATDVEAQPLKRELHRFGHRQPACRALVESHYGIGGLIGGGGVVRARRLSPLLALRAGGAPHRPGRLRRLLRPASRPWLPDPARAADVAVGAVRSGDERLALGAAPTTPTTRR